MSPPVSILELVGSILVSRQQTGSGQLLLLYKQETDQTGVGFVAVWSKAHTWMGRYCLATKVSIPVQFSSGLDSKVAGVV